MGMMMPKPPKIPQATKDAQKAQAAAEAERVRALKEKQLEASKAAMVGNGIRSLITSSGAGYGRNFF